MPIDPDFDFELFPPSEARPSRVRPWMVVAAVVAFWFVDRPFAVATACVAVALPDFREGRRLLRAIPDRAGAWICALFRFAWGAWKVEAVAFAFGALIATMLWAGDAESPPRFGARGAEPPPEFMVVISAWVVGFVASAALTAAGMIVALRSGMRVWIGEGVNHARILLLGMIAAGFAIAVMAPCIAWMANMTAGPQREGAAGLAVLAPLLVISGVVPYAILFTLDRISRRVVAERPGKFGPKVPSVGKWNV